MSIRNIILAAAGGSELWTLVTKKVASDIAANDSFGQWVAMSGDRSTCAVGSPNDDNAAGLNAGSVYIYTASGSSWSEQQKLIPPSVGGFGLSVALSSDGSTCAVGARGDDNAGWTSAGAVYVYTRSGATWALQQKLTASDGSAYKYFGSSVALSADGATLAVGAEADNVIGGYDGSVYIFTRTGSAWGQQAKFRGSASPINSSFGGSSVALSSDGNTCACSSLSDEAFVFTRSGSTWSQQARLMPSDIVSGDRFGMVVAISSDGNTLAATSFYDDNSAGSDAGAVYIFTRTGSAWTQQDKLIGSLAGAGSGVSSVDLSADGNTCAIGSGDSLSLSGVVYIFVRSGGSWSEQKSFTATDAASLGSAVSISGDGLMLAAGAPLTAIGINSMGAVYFVGK